MKVLFVIQGEGRGHLTQALTLEKILRDNGHEVVGMLVGKSRSRTLPAFFTARGKAPVTTFSSPNFVPSKDGCHIGHVKSTLYNIVRLPKYARSMMTIMNAIFYSSADIVVNFYEIMCSLTYAFFRPTVPEVCIGHQYMFLHPGFTFPKAHPHSRWWLRFFTRLTALGASRVLALSMSPYADAADQKLTVVPPLLRDEVKEATCQRGDYITGYILNAGFAESVRQWHERHPEVRMQFFWDKAGADRATKIDDTLSFHLIDDKAFICSLAGCMAYATTGGFESVCEAMYMGKPALMVPAHIEQECNAFDAEQHGAGTASEEFDLDRLLDFAKDYHTNEAFRQWEDSASMRIIAILENVSCDGQVNAELTVWRNGLSGMM